jgi:predicted amidophosphoribosyltransferase
MEGEKIRFKKLFKKGHFCWGCSSVVEQLPSMCKTLGSRFYTYHEREEEREREREQFFIQNIFSLCLRSEF